MKKLSHTRLDATVWITRAFVLHNSVSSKDVPAVIQLVHAAFCEVPSVKSPGSPVRKKDRALLTYAAGIEKIVCLECGAAFRTLRRHLNETHAMSRDEYRKKWDLPFDFMTIAPSYVAIRREIAVTVNNKKKRRD